MEDNVKFDLEASDREHQRLKVMDNFDLVEEMAEADVPEELWHEIGLRLGCGMSGVRLTNRWMPEAERLRRYTRLWEGQPEGFPVGTVDKVVADFGDDWQPPAK